MQYIPGLLAATLDTYTNRKWYHQRFDGSPYFLHLIGEAEIAYDTEMKNGAGFTVHYCFFDKGKADWYILMDDIEQVYKAVYEQALLNPNVSADLMDRWMAYAEKFYALCTEMRKVDLAALTDGELLRLHDDLLESVLHKNSSSSIIDGFALGSDTIIEGKIRAVYDHSPTKMSRKFSEVFSVLTAPVHSSFVNDAELSIYELSLRKRQGEDIADGVAEHQRTYYWIRNNYVDWHILSIDEINREIDAIVNGVKDIAGEIAKIRSGPAKNKRAKAELMSQMTLSRDILTLIKISEDFTHWQDERKKGTLFSMHHFSLLLREVGRRKDVDLEHLKYISPRELRLVLDGGIVTQELEERREKSVIFWNESGHEIVSGEGVDGIMEKIVGITVDESINDFRGLTASLGKAEGIVKIMETVKDITKIEAGDILVAVMTRPDYVPAMKKAAAIVTDEGGITSHAAIVSRELGVPCVIGTKIATKVLKDGDRVFVNADHGYVKILDKNHTT